MKSRAGGRRSCLAPGGETENSIPLHMGLSIIYRQGKVMHDKAMRQYGLSGQQMGYLKYICSHPGVSQEEVARNLRIDKGAVAKSMKVMMEKGYVIRKQNPEDKRGYCLFPTERAEQIHQCGEAHALGLERQLTEGMTQREIDTFKQLLTKIIKNMETMLEGGDE